MLNSKTLSNKLLILDKIQDPGSLGALMRSAYAFGFDTIILNHGSVDIYNDKVIRTSQGAIFKLNFRYEDLKTFIPTLTSYKVYGTNVINGISLDDAVFDDKVALVLGNEGNGISEEVFNVIQKNIYIPLKNTESLNVSVAGAIIMYEMSKKA
jgi:TrmH family RNA methyltransferase